ncbi:MAG TPA: lipocalin-like domain-containing protein [Steroidobacteraceae bacterium]|nr:lipocalin-like domain-containing protein [Steroidobacteraceae bacterium]
MKRIAIALSVTLLALSRNESAATEIAPGHRIELPRDAGSHPAFRTEWWYLTGSLIDEHGTHRGFQVTFFRSRNQAADANPSAFAPKQILFAHAAVSDPSLKKLLRAERTARAGFGLAEAAEQELNVFVDRWSLRDDGQNIHANIVGAEFALELTLTQTQPIMLNGENGYSRKSTSQSAASYYYSLPQLRVEGSITVQGRKILATGSAWFDHEWSDTYVDAQTSGWDWIGINFDNGDALMAFRMRDLHGGSSWSNATWRKAIRTSTIAPKDISWTPIQHWRSPRTGVDYPVAWRIRVGALEFTLRPLMSDQESDARGSVGILYWEGAVEVFDAKEKSIGDGYLELTGYGEPVQL